MPRTKKLKVFQSPIAQKLQANKPINKDKFVNSLVLFMQ